MKHWQKTQSDCILNAVMIFQQKKCKEAHFKVAQSQKKMTLLNFPFLSRMSSDPLPLYCSKHEDILHFFLAVLQTNQ